MGKILWNHVTDFIVNVKQWWRFEQTRFEGSFPTWRNHYSCGGLGGDGLIGGRFINLSGCCIERRIMPFEKLLILSNVLLASFIAFGWKNESISDATLTGRKLVYYVRRKQNETRGIVRVACWRLHRIEKRRVITATYNSCLLHLHKPFSMFYSHPT